MFEGGHAGCWCDRRGLKQMIHCSNQEVKEEECVI